MKVLPFITWPTVIAFLLFTIKAPFVDSELFFKITFDFEAKLSSAIRTKRTVPPAERILLTAKPAYVPVIGVPKIDLKSLEKNENVEVKIMKKVRN